MDRQARDRRGAVEISEPGPLLCEVDVDNGHHQLGETFLYGGFVDLSEQVEAWHHAPDRPDGPGRYVQHFTQAEAKLDELLAE